MLALAMSLKPALVLAEIAEKARTALPCIENNPGRDLQDLATRHYDVPGENCEQASEAIFDSKKWRWFLERRR